MGVLFAHVVAFARCELVRAHLPMAGTRTSAVILLSALSLAFYTLHRRGRTHKGKERVSTEVDTECDIRHRALEQGVMTVPLTVHGRPCEYHANITDSLMDHTDQGEKLHTLQERVKHAHQKHTELVTTNQILKKRAAETQAHLLETQHILTALKTQRREPPSAPFSPPNPGFSQCSSQSPQANVASPYMSICSSSWSISGFTHSPSSPSIESFSHHFPLSLDAVLETCSRDAVVSNLSRQGLDVHAQLLPALIESHKATAADSVRHSVSDICWFVQTPFRLKSGATLSFSSTLSSLECCTSFLVFHLASTLEGAMISHQLTLTNPSAQQDVHTDVPDATLNNDGLLIQLKALASQECMPQMFEALPSSTMGDSTCSCNVLERFELPAAVSEIMSAVLNQYRSSLPHHRWAQVCAEFAQMLMLLRQVWLKHGQAGTALLSRTSPTHMAPADAFKFNLLISKLIIIRYAAGELLNAVCDELTVETAQRRLHDLPPVSKVPCEARMHALFGSWSLGVGQAFIDARSLMRRLTISAPSELPFGSIEENQKHLFSMLRLSPWQVAKLDSMWQHWVASRVAMDGELSCSLDSLHAAASNTVPVKLIHFVSAVASDTKPAYRSATRPPRPICSAEMLRSAAVCSTKLLGLSYIATSEANRALRKLHEVHDHDASLLESFIAAITVPGALLTPQQHAILCSNCVSTCTAFVDLLGVAQSAATEEKRMRLVASLSSPASLW